MVGHRPSDKATGAASGPTVAARSRGGTKGMSSGRPTPKQSAMRCSAPTGRIPSSIPPSAPSTTCGTRGPDAAPHHPGRQVLRREASSGCVGLHPGARRHLADLACACVLAGSGAPGVTTGVWMPPRFRRGSTRRNRRPICVAAVYRLPRGGKWSALSRLRGTRAVNRWTWPRWAFTLTARFRPRSET